MGLGALTIYGSLVRRGSLNERFAAYVRWIVEAVGTRAMKIALSDTSVAVQFWLHGQPRPRFDKRQHRRLVLGQMRARKRHGASPRVIEAFKAMGIEPPASVLNPQDLTHHTYWSRRADGRPGIRYVVQVMPLALIDPYVLPQVIIHELKHLTDNLEGAYMGQRWAEPRAKRAEQRVLAITDGELRAAYFAHFGAAFADQLGEDVLTTSPRAAQARWDRTHAPGYKEERAARRAARQPRVRKP